MFVQRQLSRFYKYNDRTTHKEAYLEVDVQAVKEQIEAARKGGILSSVPVIVGVEACACLV